MSHPKHLIRIISAICLAMALSGCIIQPAYGPYYHHRHYHEGY